MIERAPIQEREARHECAIVGIALATRQKEHSLLIKGLHALQHRGHEASGITWAGGAERKIKVYKNLGLVSTVFNEEVLEHTLPTFSPFIVGMGHNRYSTVDKGNMKAERRNVQPFYFDDCPTPFALEQNGNVYPKGVALDKGEPTSDTFQVGKQIQEFQNKGLSFEESVIKALGKLDGAYAFLFMTNDTLYAARDPWGIRPLVYGVLNNGIHGTAVASESIGLKKMGAGYRGELPRGTFMKIDPDKEPVPIWKHPKTDEVSNGSCSFEPAYFSDHTSKLDEETTVHKYRFAVGALLAERVRPEGDVVEAVPESGNSYAKGVAHALGLELGAGINKVRFYGRSFTKPLSAYERSREPDDKFVLIDDEIKGKKLIVVDDSIVRGNTMRGLILKLFGAGAESVHLLVGVPPIIAPCPSGIDFKHNKELAFHELVDPSKGYDQELFEERLARFLVNGDQQFEGRVAVNFLTVDEYQKLNPGGCYHCVTGEAPEGSFVPVEMRGNLFAREK